MELLIVSGLSGAGKSVAMNALEDIGFFCIDNVPAGLLPSITAFSEAGDSQLERVALSMDVRGCRTSVRSTSWMSRVWIIKFYFWMPRTMYSCAATARPAAATPSALPRAFPPGRPLQRNAKY